MPHPDDDAPPTPTGWRPQFTWSALLLGGLLVYEATSQPGLAAAFTCAKFGWADFRTAFWLRRVDPNSRRGRTCFWFYLAYGLWKIALMGVAMSVALAMLGSLLHGRRRPPAAADTMLVGILITSGIGFGLSFLATYVALASALINGVKVWLGFAPHRAREFRYWPPHRGATNAAAFVTVTTLILTLWILLLTLLALVIAWALRGLVLFVMMIGMFFVVFPALLFLCRLLDGRVFARSPADCWDAAPAEHVYEARDEAAAGCLVAG
jgi:hypothetical protein